MGSRVFSSLVVLFVGLACGCGSTDQDKPSSAQELPQAFAEAVCSSLARCCEHQSHDFDRAQCQQSLKVDIAGEVAEYDGLRVDFDADAAALCIADYANAACLAKPSEPYDVKRHCKVMFKGRVEPGGSCQSSDECRVEPGRESQCVEGVCELESEPAAGASLGEQCGSTCKRSSADQLGCEPALVGFEDPAEEPGLPPCFTSDELQCSGVSGARTCQPLIAEGESCAGSSLGCSPGTFCDLDTRLCLAQTESGPCDPQLATEACTANASCDVDAGRCVVVGARDGVGCAGNADCRSGYCNPSSVCQAPISAASCAQPQLGN
jgi:hypothetical protein